MTPSARGHATVFGFLALFLVGGLIALDALVDVWHARHHHTQRNYHRARGWVEHAGEAQPKQPGETLVVLIGNSQGFGKAVADSLTCAARLQQLLTARLGPTRVLNWSVEGGRAAEFVVLGAAATQLNPDVVLILGSASNFEVPPTEAGQSAWLADAWASDAKRLMGMPGIRERVPQAFQDRFVSRSDRLNLALGQRFRLWRYRYAPFGAVTKGRALKPFRVGFAEATLPEWRLNGVPDRWMVDQVREAVIGEDTHAILISMPLSAERRAAKLRDLPTWWGEPEVMGAAYRDLTAALPDSEFLDDTHLTAAGHQSLALILAEMISP